MMAQQSKVGNATEEEIQEYLNNGGKITVCEPGARTEIISFKGGFYGKKTKKDDEE
jgi:predicted peroxiredoxin